MDLYRLGGTLIYDNKTYRAGEFIELQSGSMNEPRYMPPRDVEGLCTDGILIVTEEVEVIDPLTEKFEFAWADLKKYIADHGEVEALNYFRNILDKYVLTRQCERSLTTGLSRKDNGLRPIIRRQMSAMLMDAKIAGGESEGTEEDS